MSQEIRRLEEREKGLGVGQGQLAEQSEHIVIQPFIKFAVLYGHGSWHPKTTTRVTSKIIDHHNIIMKKLEIL